MALDPGMRGLSLDQAPPLSIPMSFFLTAPLALASAGVVVAATSAATFATRWAPTAAAAVHLGTLGFLATTMLGALYQMLPVVASTPVPAVRLAHGVHAALVAGAASLAFAMARGDTTAFTIAIALLVAAFAAFLVPVAIAAVRARAKLDTVPGVRLAIAALVALVAIGVEMALGRAGLRFVADLPERLLAHVGLGIVGWVGGLIVPISWQVVPMFYLTEAYPRWSRRTSLVAIGATIAGVVVATLAGASTTWIALALAPGAIVVFALHPAITLARIVRRRRRRVGESVRFWLVAMGVAPLVLVIGALAFFLDDPRLVVLFGWLALVGWSSLVVHGMLTRIVPFLVWFHRFSSLVGQPGVPSMRELLPDARARVGLVLHVAATVLGALAIVTQWRLLGVASGLALVATGVALFVALVRALTFAPKST